MFWTFSFSYCLALEIPEDPDAQICISEALPVYYRNNLYLKTHWRAKRVSHAWSLLEWARNFCATLMQWELSQHCYWSRNFTEKTPVWCGGVGDLLFIILNLNSSLLSSRGLTTPLIFQMNTLTTGQQCTLLLLSLNPLGPTTVEPTPLVLNGNVPSGQKAGLRFLSCLHKVEKLQWERLKCLRLFHF